MSPLTRNRLFLLLLKPVFPQLHALKLAYIGYELQPSI